MSGSLVHLYQQLHRSNKGYGGGPGPVVLQALREFVKGMYVKRALDWGCGNSHAITDLFPDAECVRYDPAIPGVDDLPSGFFDFGICTDVLEHIPEGELTDLFTEMYARTPRWAFVVHTGLAATILPDGQNAHCTVRSHDWWVQRIEQGFGVAAPLDIGLSENDLRKGVTTYVV